MGKLLVGYTMTDHIEPFALQLYRRFKDGESIEALASCLGIPEDRVRQRIRVASAFHTREMTHSGVGSRFVEVDGAFAS